MKSSTRIRIEESHLSALKNRRQNFLKSLGNGIGIVTNHVVPDAFHRFSYRPSSSFYYLTGLAEDSAVAVFAPNHPTEKCILFLRERDSAMELWNGPMAGLSGATDVLGFDAAYPLDTLAAKLPSYFKDVDSFYWNNDPRGFYSSVIFELIESSRARRQGADLNVDVEKMIGEQRLIKDEWEIEQLQIANDIASRAHEAAMRRAKPGLFEFQVQASLEGEMLEKGSLIRGYPCIVASGENACCLHYSLNNSRLDDGELMLIDAGTEHNFYTSDITRTFPVNGKFTAEQRAVYEVVLGVQNKIIELVKPGIRFQSLNEMTIELLSEGLIELGLLKASKAEVKEKELFRQFYPHGVSHWLGLDVHDVGKYRVQNQERQLEQGMCFTVEPGIYIQPDNMNVEERWRGIGVRIEDNLCVTKTGVRNFTSCVKSITDVESMCQ